jgi:hypothetical protein
MHSKLLLSWPIQPSILSMNIAKAMELLSLELTYGYGRLVAKHVLEVYNTEKRKVLFDIILRNLAQLNARSLSTCSSTLAWRSKREKPDLTRPLGRPLLPTALLVRMLSEVMEMPKFPKTRWLIKALPNSKNN